MALNLEVNILGEFKNLTRATKGATKQLRGLQSSVTSISRGINTAFATIGVGLSLNAISGAIRGAVREASTLEESVNAVRVAFGPAAEEVLKLGDNSAKSFGLARSEFNSAAVRFSAFATVIAKDGGTAAGVVEELTGRAADFASVFNIDVDEALRVFQSGLAGESEPLRRFGVILTDTEVKGFAYANRIAEVGKELTATQKTQARYGLLLQETNKVQGDFANTSGSMANALRIMRSGFQDASASVGNGFTPAIAAAATFISSNIATFDALGEAIGTRLRAAFEGTGGAAESFGAKIITTLTDLTDFLNGTAAAGNQFTKLNEQIGPILDLLGAFAELAKGVLAVINGVIDGLFGWTSVFTGAENATVGLADVVRFIGETLQTFGNIIGFIISLFVPFTATFKLVGIVVKNIQKPFQIVGAFVKNLTDNFGNFISVLKRVEGPGEKVRRAFDFILGTVRSTAGQFDTAKQKLNTYAKALDAQDNKRIRNFVDIIANTTAAFTIPASPTDDSSRPTGILKPGYREEFIGRDNQWYTRTWTGTGWKVQKMSEAYETPATTTGSGDSAFQTRVKAIVAKLQDTLTEARDRIRNASESFRDSVDLSFGIVSNGFVAKFSVSRVIAQMKRIKTAVATFSKDIIELRKKGADAALIDELIGLGPLAGAAAAKSLVQSGSFDEFIGLRRDLQSSGAAVGAAGNLAITGTSTSGLTTAINGLNRTIAAGKGSTYNISIANPNITPQQIIAQIKAYEKKTGKKVFSN